ARPSSASPSRRSASSTPCGCDPAPVTVVPCNAVAEMLLDKLRARRSGIALYGLAPPKRATAPERLREVAGRQRQRLQRLRPDGVIVYDLQDEGGRTSEPRPFPFLPTVDPCGWADEIAPQGLPAIVYRCVGQDAPDTLAAW